MAIATWSNLTGAWSLPNQSASRPHTRLWALFSIPYAPSTATMVTIGSR